MWKYSLFGLSALAGVFLVSMGLVELIGILAGVSTVRAEEPISIGATLLAFAYLGSRGQG